MKIEKLKYYKKSLLNAKRDYEKRNTKDAKLNKVAADLIRNTHSIEKGLSILNPRLGFGHKKQEDMLKQIELIASSNDAYHKEACAMAIDAFKEYLDFHKAHEYSDSFMEEISKCVEKYSYLCGDEKKGGTILLEKSSMQFPVSDIEHFFMTRHSIRDFEDTEVNQEVLKKALILAQKAPSACNRQGVRAYVLKPSEHKDFVSQLSGIGGFAEEVKNFIIITAKTSAYTMGETNQYIVSASMYASYLTLTLHLYGLGACVVQRPVIWTKEWESNKQVFGIDDDEQIICLLAVGNLKQSCTVPLSHRIDASEMIHFI